MNIFYSASIQQKDFNKPLEYLLSHFALWFGVIFATPIFVTAHNQADMVLNLNSTVVILALSCLFFTGLSSYLASKTRPAIQYWISRVMLTIAIVSAIQGNLITDQFYYGTFNGEAIQLRSHGWLFYAEWILYLTMYPVALFVLSRISKIPLWLPVLVVGSFLQLPLSMLVAKNPLPDSQNALDVVNPSVFEFSSKVNLIHLLPDGMQGDVVQEVFEQNPDLAAKFEGYTLYTNHLGLYQGTGPAMYTLLTGEPFELAKGHEANRVKAELNEKSYQKGLLDEGYSLDYVPIIPYVCPDYASSCHPRPFNDMKARGYFRHKSETTIYSIRMILDLSLFRLSPMFLKEKIYNGGHWFISDTSADGSSPWPDPIIREWVENLTITDKHPVYKWYHYIGSHIPPHWDSDCVYHRELLPVRANYKAQTYCLLSGIARLNDRLQSAEIYDKAAILISSDHGHNTVPKDLLGRPNNSSLYLGMMGSARPTLLVKQLNNREPLHFSSLPTSLVDVAPTALELVGIESAKTSIFELQAREQRERHFTPYSLSQLWSGNSIPFNEYKVSGPAGDGSKWELTGIELFKQAPAAYEKVNYSTAHDFMLGATLNKKQPDNEASWVTGTQLAFLLFIEKVDDPMTLKLSLRVPDWIDQQDILLSVNNETNKIEQKLDQSGVDWQVVDIPLQKNSLVNGNNFFSIEFGKSLTNPDNVGWAAAALIKSIEVVPTN